MEKNHSIISGRSLILLLPSAAGIALLAAYASEIFLRLHPCHLCLYQRIPYFIVLSLGILCCLSMKKIESSKSLQKNILLLFSVIFLANAALAFYHAGVEYKLFEGPGGCSATSSGAENAEEMLKHIMGQAVVSCSEASFTFLGLSMAGWNALYALGFAALGFYWSRKKYVKAN